jgi:inosine/xanthosine triphosphatase
MVTIHPNVNDKCFVAVGSQNPAKISAVKEVFRSFFDAKIEGLAIDSGVSHQPFNEETFLGAQNRAQKALDMSAADYGVGIEGGIIELNSRWYNLGYVVILHQNGEMSTGSSGWFECPQIILNKIRTGKELADAMDEVSDPPYARTELGAIGFLTKNHVTRKDLYVHGVYMALLPFINHNLYRSYTK